MRSPFNRCLWLALLLMMPLTGYTQQDSLITEVEKSLRELPASQLVRTTQVRQVLKQNLLKGEGKRNVPFITYLELNASDSLLHL